MKAGNIEQRADLDTLRRLNQNFVRSVEESDVGYFEEALAEDFLNSNPDGSLVDRVAFLEQIARPAMISQLESHDVRIRLLGDIAIIHARTTYRKTDGREGAGRYTDVWARREGRWLCIAAHVTRG
jgi:ketosteroid isomerase-like protein